MMNEYYANKIVITKMNIFIYNSSIKKCIIICIFKLFMLTFITLFTFVNERICLIKELTTNLKVV